MISRTSGSLRSTAWRRVSGPIATLLLIALLEALSTTGHALVDPGTILLLPIAYSAFVGGLGPGLFSAMATVVFTALFFADQGTFFHFQPDNLQRVVITLIMAPAMAFLANELRKRELRLAQSEDARIIAEDAQHRIAGIIASITDGFFALDADRRFTFINSKAAQLLGVSGNDLVGQPFPQSPTVQHLATLEAHISHSLQNAVATEYTERSASSGTTLDVHVYPSAGGVSVYLQDVSEREKVEEARRLSEAKFTNIVSIASDAIISVNTDQEIQNFNRGAEEIFGYTADEVIGKKLEILLPQRFRDPHGAHVRSFGSGPVQSRRMGERREISGRRKGGEEFPADASISKLQVGHEVLYTVVLRDVSARKRYEQTQQFLAEAGKALTASLDVGKTLETVAGLIVPQVADWCVIYVRDDDHGLVRVALAHCDPETNQRLHKAGLNLPASRPEHPAHRVFENGQPVLFREITEQQLLSMAEDPEHERLLKEIGARSAIIVPMTARGETTGAIAFFTSTNARAYDDEDLALAIEVGRRAGLAIDNARLYRAAQSAIQARDDVLAVVSHDLGNPLSAIRIGTTLLLSSISENERETGGWKHIVGIRNSAEQMERLIKDLLEVKRIEAGQLSVERGRVAVAPLIAEAIELLTPISEGKHISIVPKLNGNVPAIYADRERLLQSFSNLVGNAVKFTPEGGTVRIEAGVDEDNVRFTVTDTGIGISPEDTQHVFDRYWQAQTRKKGKVGIGLGLVIVKGIIEAHGGRVWVDSEIGTGSKFHFTVPIWRNQIQE